MARVTVDVARRRLDALSVANARLVHARVAYAAALADARHALACLTPAERDAAIDAEGFGEPEDRAELLGGAP